MRFHESKYYKDENLSPLTEADRIWLETKIDKEIKENQKLGNYYKSLNKKSFSKNFDFYNREYSLWLKAKQRIKSPDFGHCKVCGNFIGKRRIMGAPYAETCLQHSIA